MRKLLLVLALSGLLGAAAWLVTQEVGSAGDRDDRRGGQSGTSQPVSPDDGDKRAEIEELTQTEGGTVTFPPDVYTGD